MNKKIIILSVAIVAIAIGIAWRQGKTTLIVKYTGPVEKIVIANQREYSIFNYLAQDKGYFKENGLDVEIKEYPSGPPAVADLLAGTVNLAFAGEFVGVSNIFSGHHLKIIAQGSKQKTVEVVARKDQGINNPYDLKGKKIGVTRKSAGEIFLGQFLTSNNLSFSDVIIVDLSPLEMIDQITAGTIDAVATFNPYPFQIKNKLGDKAIVWSAQGDQGTYVLLYGTDEFIKSHPQVVERYMQSLLQAEQYAKSHNTEVKNLMMSSFHYDDSYVTYMWPKISFSLALEQELVLTLEDEARFAIANKLTEQTKVPNYLDFIYFDALTKVKPEAVTIVH